MDDYPNPNNSYRDYSTVPLGSDIELQYGTPTVAIRQAVMNTKPGEVRHHDIAELTDTLHNLSYSNSEIFGADFGMLLSLCLGLGQELVRFYSITELHSGKPLFLATLTRVGNESVCVMGGYALTEVYYKLTRKEQYVAILGIFEILLSDLMGVFGSGLVVCHVAASNKPTLRMWNKLARSKMVVYGQPIRINITDDPFTRSRPYKLVTLSIGDE